MNCYHHLEKPEKKILSAWSINEDKRARKLSFISKSTSKRQESSIVIKTLENWNNQSQVEVVLEIASDQTVPDRSDLRSD